MLGFAHLDVGELIPGEVDVDIDGYARLVSAVENIQSRVADNPKAVRPAVIARFEHDDQNAPLDSDYTLGVTWGLARLAASVSLQESQGHLTDELKKNPRFAEGVSRAYRTVMGSTDEPVTPAHAAAAKSRLHAITVAGPLSTRPIPPRPVP